MVHPSSFSAEVAARLKTAGLFSGALGAIAIGEKVNLDPALNQVCGELRSLLYLEQLSGATRGEFVDRLRIALDLKPTMRALAVRGGAIPLHEGGKVLRWRGE